MRRRKGIDSVYLGCKSFSYMIPVTAMESLKGGGGGRWDELGACV